MLFDEGVPKLVQMSGKSEKAARSYLGLLLSTMQEDAGFVLSVVQEAHGRWVNRDTELADACSWISKQVKIKAEQLGYTIPRGPGRPPKENPATEQVNGVLDAMDLPGWGNRATGPIIDHQGEA